MEWSGTGVSHDSDKKPMELNDAYSQLRWFGDVIVKMLHS